MFFVFVINDANIDAQTANPFLHNTFSVSTDPRTLSNCHLEVGNGNEYPEIHYAPTTDMTSVHKDILKYVYKNNEFGVGTLPNRANCSTLFPFLYFDLTKQKMDIKDGTTKLTFKYELSGTTATYRRFKNYYSYGVSLSKGQLVKLSRAYNKNSAATNQTCK